MTSSSSSSTYIDGSASAFSSSFTKPKVPVWKLCLSSVFDVICCSCCFKNQRERLLFEQMSADDHDTWGIDRDARGKTTLSPSKSKNSASPDISVMITEEKTSKGKKSSTTKNMPPMKALDMQDLRNRHHT